MNKTFIQNSGLNIRVSDFSSRALLATILTFFLLGAMILFVFSQMSYQALCTVIDQHTTLPNPVTSYLTKPIYQMAIRGAQVAVLLYLLFFALGLVFAKKILAFFPRLRTDYRQMWCDAKEWFQSSIASLPKIYFLLFCLILLIGIGLRVFYLNQPIRNDEATIFLRIAKYPLPFIIANYSNVGNHIFQTILLHFSWKLFGDAVWVIRLFPFLSGVLLIPLVFLVTRYAFGIKTALFASTLVACSSALIEYSVNSRGYEVQTLFLISILGLGQYLLHHGKNQAGWVLWVILTTLAFWTLPTTVYAYGGIAIWFLGNLALKRECPSENITKTETLKSFIAYNIVAAVLVLILYSPIFIVFRIGHMSTSLVPGNAGFNEVPLLVTHLWNTWLRNFPVSFQWIFIIPLLFGFIPPKNSKFKLNIFLCCLAWPLLIAFITPPYGLTLILSRIWLPYSLFFYITLSIGMSHVVDWLQRLLEDFSRHFRLPRSGLKNNYFALRQGRTCSESAVYTRVHEHRGTSPNAVLKQKSIFEATATKMAILICMLLLFIGANEEIRNRYIYNIKIDSFQDAKMVTQYFQNNLQAGDLILAPCPYGMPLIYEFSKQNTPFTYVYLPDEMGTPQQIYLYGVDKKVKIKKADLYFIEDASKTLNDILRQVHFEDWLKQPIEKVACFEKTTLYRIHLEEIDVQ